ncbi:MAG TPA: ChbG/HpnK family deacetylase [Thermoanaerobaculia bacterium]|nr:ChbG/HpnK family deacetylase [Thermoanaerobaculia bacterium]
MRRLVVTADDVGLAPGMTRGALEAAECGIVTAVSVAPVGEAFDDAVAQLRRVPQLDVGAHFVLVGERPLSPPAEVPSLLGRDDRLLPGFAAFCARYARGGIVLDELRRELGRQLALLLDSGLRVLHLNSHQHLHALPRVFDVMVELAAEHGIPFVRIPDDPQLPAPVTSRAAALHALRALARRRRRRVGGDSRVQALDGVLGLYAAGHLTPRRLQAVLATRWQGRYELVCHPGSGAADLASRYRWGYDWDAERAALCDPALPALLAAHGIELTSFARLLTSPATPPAASPGRL